MEKEVLLDKKNLVEYIISAYNERFKRKITPIKLQKSLYFLYAMWGGKIMIASGQSEEDTECDELYGRFTKELFEAQFLAWRYGPIDKEVYDNYRDDKYNFEIENIELQFKSNDEEENFTAKDYIDNLLRRIFITSDFALVDLSHEDKCWKNAVNTPGQKMSNECILNEYATKSL